MPQGEMPLLAAFIAVVLFAGSIFGIDKLSGGLVRGYARAGGSTIWAAASAASSAVTHSGAFSTRRALEKENIKLAEEIAARDEEAARFSALKDENDALRAMADLASGESNGVTAPVLSSFRTSPYGTFVIGAGARDGVEEGSLVLTPGGFVLGAVTSTSAHEAQVRSVYAAGNETDVVARDIAFVMEGRGGGNARAEVARDTSLSANDVVTAQAFSGRPTGIIGKIESASSSAKATLYIRIPVNLDALSFVYVIARQ